MNILALDTSTDVASVAIVIQGKLVAELCAHVRARHGETLLPHVEHVLGLAGLSVGDVGLVAVGLGPGSFTGVRIGVATAKGLALANGLPLVGVVSLRALARAVATPGSVIVPTVDAHKGEVFVGAYAVSVDGTLEERTVPFHETPAAAGGRIRDALGSATAVVLGSGLRKHADAFPAAIGQPTIALPEAHDVPRAAFIAFEGTQQFEQRGADDLVTLEPLYVRPSDARLPDA